VEQLPTGNENPPQAPDWWVELKFKDWLNARKRKSQRFSQPERWEKRQQTAIPLKGSSTSERQNSTSEGQESARSPLWGGGDVDEEKPFPKSKIPADKVWAEIRKEQMDKLASLGITFEGTSEVTWAELDAAWDEYERRINRDKVSQP